MSKNSVILRSLQIAFWNANGLQQARNELEEFIDRHHLDVVLVSETKLRAATRDPNIPGFTLVRTDRPTGPGGGTAIYIRKILKFYVAEKPDLRHLEATGVTVVTESGPLRLFACYNRPGLPLLESDLRALVGGPAPAIAAGDFNAKHKDWNSRTTNPSGKTLHRFSEDNFDVVIMAPVGPTYHNYSTGRPDILDVAVVKNVANQIQLTAVNELCSDHSPVLMHVGNEANEPEVICYRPINWENFTTHVDENFGPIPRIDSAAALDAAVQMFETKVQEAIAAATRVFPQPRQRRTIPQRIVDLIKEKNRARRIARRTGLAVDRTEANRLQYQVKSALVDFRNEQWERKILSLNTEDNSVWRITKALRSNRKPLPPIHGAQGIVFSNEEKAEAFADSLELQCRANDDDADEDHIEDVEAHVDAVVEEGVPETPIPPTSPAEVSEVIRGLKTRKASGPDGISNKALKHLPLKAIVALTGIVNSIFRYRHFPDRWKLATVIFIPKPGKDPQFPQNHRPISLLSAAGKVAERLIHSRLEKSVKEFNIIPDEQFGFRPHHSTTDQLLRVVEHACHSFRYKRVTGAVFLDIAKAFDTVWHGGLVYKLHQAGIPLAMVQLIHSFLQNRTFQARIQDSISEIRHMEAGVPQGSVLSPILYAVYTADVPKTKMTSLAVYADDTAILARSTQPQMVTRYLQEAMDRLEEWCSLWRISVNPEKSSAILMTRRRFQPEGDVKMFDRVIPWVNQVKYLGVILDKTLRFGPHLDYTVAKAKAVIGQLSSLTCRRSKMSYKNKLLLYRSIIRPTLTYASAAWEFALTKAQHEKLQVVQNKFLRMAFNAPWFVRGEQLHREAELPMLRQHLDEISRRTLRKADTHPNRLVREAVNYDEAGPSRCKRPRMVLLEDDE